MGASKYTFMTNNPMMFQSKLTSMAKKMQICLKKEKIYCKLMMEKEIFGVIRNKVVLTHSTVKV